MKTYTFEPRLCELLVKLAEGERSVEILRQVLCEERSFEPMSAFMSLDSLSLGYLLPSNIRNFLSLHSIPATDLGLYLLIKQYDSSCRGKLSLMDFHNLTLSAALPKLRRHVLKKPQKLRGKMEYPVSYTLAKLLEKELRLMCSLEEIKHQLCSTKDYSFLKAFECLDRKRKGYITDWDVCRFVEDNKNFLVKEDLDAIIRRLDSSGDGVVSYTEFIDFILPLSKGLPSFAAVQKSTVEPLIIEENLRQKSTQTEKSYLGKISRIEGKLFANKKLYPGKIKRRMIPRKLRFDTEK